MIMSKNNEKGKISVHQGHKYNMFFKLLHLFWLEMCRAIFGKKFVAEFDITNRCNLRCKHCYNKPLMDDDTNEYPLKIWKKRFDEMYESGIRLVQIMGGEPTLRMDVIEYAVNTFPFVYVSTNGLIKIPNEWDINIILSIDGGKENNDAIRGEGVFKSALDNYCGDVRVMVNMVLTMENYKDLEDMVLLAKKCNFRGVLCNIFSTLKDNTDKTLSSDERKILIDELRRVRSLHPDTLLMNERMIRWYEEPDHRDSCHWREQIYHYDVDWELRVCYSNNPDCSNCGCMAGAMQSPLRMIRYSSDLIKIVLPKKQD